MRAFAFLLFPVLLAGQGGGGVQFRDWTSPATAKPRATCTSLLSLTGTEYSVIGAHVIPALNGVPEHCRVSVMVQPELNIEINLPTAWNSRFLMFGNGGFAGESFEAAGRAAIRARALTGGFVTAASDTGHSAALEPGGTFAVNKQKFLDWAFRAPHVTAQAARVFIKAYYGENASKSYYDGCSTGGRQGLILAQRFPEDFDGILVGAPALAYTSSALARISLLKAVGKEFPAKKTALLADKIYAQCDAKDGLKDGVIDDPRRCDFRPSRDLPVCSANGDGPECFTNREIAAIDKLHSEVTRGGKPLAPAWPVGAEAAPANGRSGLIGNLLPGADGSPAGWNYYGEGFLRYVVPQRPVDGDVIADFDLEKDIPRLPFLRDTLDATDTDLLAFRNHGGKILMYFGWADPLLNPMMGVNYYEQVTAKMGTNTPDFFRLFMVPGMFHCSGGVGTSTFDADTPLVKWVESNQAPDVIPAARVVQGKTDRTRPLCAYPKVARYKGSGSTDDAANFSCVNP